MRNLLRKYLGIVEPHKCECKCTTAKEITDSVGEMLALFSETKCKHCERTIIAHMGGFYKNFKGEVYCSHECIDRERVVLSI